MPRSSLGQQLFTLADDKTFEILKFVHENGPVTLNDILIMLGQENKHLSKGWQATNRRLKLLVAADLVEMQKKPDPPRENVYEVSPYPFQRLVEVFQELAK